MRIDLNCDLGEAFGNYSFGGDNQIIPLITSANIACGFHAGDENVMYDTIKLVKDNGVGIELILITRFKRIWSSQHGYYTKRNL